MPHTTETIEYGVRYANGTEDWDTARWFGTIDLPETRATFKEQYDLRMSGMGAPLMPLIFLRRVKTVTYDAAEVIDDSVVPETNDPEEEVIEDGTEPERNPEAERE